eukprot:scaffold4258_cov32-Tisochrysis_lutea.AAC.1
MTASASRTSQVSPASNLSLPTSVRRSPAASCMESVWPIRPPTTPERCAVRSNLRGTRNSVSPFARRCLATSAALPCTPRSSTADSTPPNEARSSKSWLIGAEAQPSTAARPAGRRTARCCAGGTHDQPTQSNASPRSIRMRESARARAS